MFALFVLTTTLSAQDLRLTLIGGSSLNTSPQPAALALGSYLDVATPLGLNTNLIAGAGFRSGKMKSLENYECPGIINGFKIATFTGRDDLKLDSRRVAGRLGVERTFQRVAVRIIAQPEYDFQDRLVETNTLFLTRGGPTKTVTEFPEGEVIGNENFGRVFTYRNRLGLDGVIELDYRVLPAVRIGAGYAYPVVRRKGAIDINCPACDVIPAEPFDLSRQAVYGSVSLSF